MREASYCTRTQYALARTARLALSTCDGKHSACRLPGQCDNLAGASQSGWWMHPPASVWQWWQQQLALKSSVRDFGSSAPSPAPQDIQQRQSGTKRSDAGAHCNGLQSRLAAEPAVPTQACDGANVETI